MRSICSLAILLVASHVEAEDWLQFRGNGTNGVSADSSVPVELSGESIQWQTKLPGRGLSGPIVVGERVFLTASSGLRELKLHTLCYDVNTGKQIWERTALATGRTVCHSKMSVATPTPASDGERVFSFYSSNDLSCYDLDGNLQWYRGLGYEYPNASNSLGMSSSPVVIGSTVIVQVESDAESFACGLDVATGATKWKLDRPKLANWTSPAVLSGSVVLLQSSAGLSAIDAETGKEYWKFDDGASTVPSATVMGDFVFFPSNGLTVLKLSADRKSYEKAWQKTNMRPSTPSPLVYEGNVYTVGSNALTCADAETGERKWQMRLKGPFSSTPLAANGYLYAFSEKGMAYVIAPGESKGQVVSQMDLAQTILCTPAISKGGLFVRSDGSLWKLAKE